MKIGKTGSILLTVGIFIIIFAGLGVIRSQQVHERNQLNDKLALAEQKLKGLKLEQLSLRQKELGKQLSQTISPPETASVILPPPPGSIAARATLFDVAEAYGVEVAEISSSGLASVDLEGVPCYVLTLKARVEGDLLNLISFIIKLNGDLINGVIKSVEISISEANSEEKSSANLQLLIYTYQGLSR